MHSGRVPLYVSMFCEKFTCGKPMLKCTPKLLQKNFPTECWIKLIDTKSALRVAKIVRQILFQPLPLTYGYP